MNLRGNLEPLRRSLTRAMVLLFIFALGIALLIAVAIFLISMILLDAHSTPRKKQKTQEIIVPGSPRTGQIVEFGS